MPLRSRLNSKRQKEPNADSNRIHSNDNYSKTRKPPKANRMSASTKENDGKARMLRRYLPWVVFLVIVNVIAVTILYNTVWSYTSTEFEAETIQVKQHHEDIVEGYLTLIGLSISREALQRTSKGTDRYGKVEATFCEIDWSRQTRNPSTTPMFKDLESKSSSCKKTKTVVADFYDLVQEAKLFDGFKNGSHRRKDNGSVFPPNGVVFHETRCGSTLFANLMAGFAPGRSRVYSESPPPPAVLSACARGYNAYCDQELHKQLIRDVFYMMGRRPPLENKKEPNYLFFKLQSTNAMNIDKFAMAMPEVPWVFVFRDTVEIMQSHTNQGERPTPGRVCTRYFSRPPHDQPSSTMEIIKDAGKSLTDLSSTEYCAAHLAGLSLAAVQEYDRTSASATSKIPGGRFVDYYQMPDIVWEKIFPDHFGVNPLPPNSVANMQATAGVYSKGRGPKANQEWTEDTTIKRKTATPEVIEAANLFASKVYERMKKLSSS